MMPECQLPTLRIVHHDNRNKRDCEIIRLLSLGYTAREIGKQGGLTERGVVAIIEKLKVAYDCKNTPHLVATFIRNKIIE